MPVQTSHRPTDSGFRPDVPSRTNDDNLPFELVRKRLDSATVPKLAMIESHDIPPVQARPPARPTSAESSPRATRPPPTHS
ncbi:hypothetical protein [Nonomuraea sp. NPDC005650]|uniref:hypothetical protein n=1 Tax=Nonomuraea sp. NPDC005650 TaxID=3157045 RepID=UPI00339E69FE